MAPAGGIPRKSFFFVNLVHPVSWINTVALNDNQPIKSLNIVINLKYKSILPYSVMLGIALCLLKWLESRFLVIDHSFEIYTGGIALIFTLLGIWLALKLAKPKIQTVTVEKEVLIFPKADNAAKQDTGISNRELEVLILMAGGLSNQEIADRLFVSLNTIKTHSSRIFEKLDVKRRTQAIEKARQMSLIPGKS